jgi:hypothetical protein
MTAIELAKVFPAAAAETVALPWFGTGLTGVEHSCVVAVDYPMAKAFVVTATAFEYTAAYLAAGKTTLAEVAEMQRKSDAIVQYWSRRPFPAHLKRCQ